MSYKPIENASTPKPQPKPQTGGELSQNSIPPRTIYIPTPPPPSNK